MSLKAIMQQVATNLAALPGLPANKYVYRYHRPINLIGPNGIFTPALSVAFRGVKPQLMDTEASYDKCHELLITWYHGQVDTGVMSGIDETAAEAALDAYAVLEEEIRSWHPNGVPGLSFQNEVTLNRTSGGKTEGGVMAFEFEMDVNTWGI